jgi:serine/threonine protein kinase
MIGKLLASGRYELVAVLGEGAQGITFEAKDREQERTVAIKRFSVRGAKSWKDVELAEREASVLASLSHPSLPKYLAHFEEDGALYLVMDKIEGRSVSELQRAGVVLDRSDVVRFLGDAARVLAFLHGRAPPVIHRDINPKNVIRRPDGSYAFVDFGAVRDRLKAQGSTVVGTFGYMAPEQFQGRALPASDVYAVAATALSMLTGTEPENLPHRGLAIDVAAVLRERADRELAGVLERMLEPDPDRRLRDLRQVLERSSRPASPGSSPVASTSGRRQQRKARRRERQQRRATRRQRPLPNFLLFFALIGLGVASVALSVALLVAVPAVLILLSVLFGSRLRDAARAVRRAGHAGNRALGRARGYLLRSADGAAGGPVRIADAEVDREDRARVRVDDGPVDPEQEQEHGEGVDSQSEPARRRVTRRAH